MGRKRTIKNYLKICRRKIGSMKVPLTIPFFDKKEERAVIEVMQSGWHTMGPKVDKFEKIFAKYVGVKYAVALSNCTTALQLALMAIGVKPGHEVIVPSFTFIASANVISHVGATPIFVDVARDTYNLNVEDLEQKITKKTKAILTVDQIGLASDIDKINKIAKKYNIPVIADAACAIGAQYKGKMVGSIADITCFSFHPRKAISTGEGGMFTTNNKKYSEFAKLWRNHGMSISDIERHKIKKFTYEKYLVPGFNYRMTDIQAAIGIEQMKKLPLILKKRAQIAKRYEKLLSKNKYLELPIEPPYATHTWQTYLVKVRENSPISVQVLVQKLLDDGVGVKRGIMACHLEPVYKKPHGKTKLPITEKLVHSSFCIPIFPQMTRKQQNYVISRINKYLN